MTDNYSMARATQEEKKYIRNKLIEYNAQHVPEHLKSRYEEINLTVKDETGAIVGGLLAQLAWNWIEVDILWVDVSCRKSGYGTKMLAEIERIAREKECSFIKLNTFSFQAPDFYKKQGFVLYAVLEEAPTGSNHYFFKKYIK